MKRAYLTEKMKSPNHLLENDHGYSTYLKNEQQKAWALAARRGMIAVYGGRCACCGESNEAFLTIHHMNGNGKEHRLHGKLRMWREIAQDSDHSKYMLLCFNCHAAGHTQEGCPHGSGLKLGSYIQERLP